MDTFALGNISWQACSPVATDATRTKTRTSIPRSLRAHSRELFSPLSQAQAGAPARCALFSKPRPFVSRQGRCVVPKATQDEASKMDQVASDDEEEVLDHLMLTFAALQQGSRLAIEDLVVTSAYLYQKGVSIPALRMQLQLRSLTKSSKVATEDQDRLVGEVAMVMLTLQELGMQSSLGVDWKPVGEAGGEDTEMIGFQNFVRFMLGRIENEGLTEQTLIMEQSMLTQEEQMELAKQPVALYMRQNSRLVLRAWTAMVDSSLLEAPLSPSQTRDLTFAFIAGMNGDINAVGSFVQQSTALLRESPLNDIMAQIPPEDLLLEGQLIPLGTAGNATSEVFNHDLLNQWFMVVYITMDMSGAICSQGMGGPRLEDDIVDFVINTMRLAQEKDLEQEQEQDAQPKKELEEGWVLDPFISGSSAAMVVMKQQTYLVELTMEYIRNSTEDATCTVD
ncbi:hypothetical protein CYMTET_5753 [Cymbomonas tetramitiformis]|uniref:Uncharacterized protein n=1 Tax=Cymbomonas tetramitiformis TaxID=36881 RepID=A0AAE0LIK1_9CHLO|nr:hypothetical protein CYMTET_5753 [Cymbomonas tetramitiformis]